MNELIRAGSDDSLIGLVIFVIIIVISLISKALKMAQGQQGPKVPPQRPVTPWEEVKRFLKEAGVQTETRPQQRQRVQRPAVRVGRAPQVRPELRSPRPIQRAVPAVEIVSPPALEQAVPPQRLGPQIARPEAATPPMPSEPARPLTASVLSLKTMSREQLRNAILFREILGPPLAMRRNPSWRELLP